MAITCLNMAKEFPWPMKSDLCEDTTYPVSLSSVIATFEESKYPALWIALQKTEDDKYFAILYHESWEETTSDGIKRVYLTKSMTDFLSSRSDDVLPVYVTFENVNTKSGLKFYKGLFKAMKKPQEWDLMLKRMGDKAPMFRQMRQGSLIYCPELKPKEEEEEEFKSKKRSSSPQRQPKKKKKAKYQHQTSEESEEEEEFKSQKRSSSPQRQPKKKKAKYHRQTSHLEEEDASASE